MDPPTSEIQAQELEALKAIFGDDFSDVEPPKAWKTAPSLPEFRIKLLALEEEIKPYVSITLNVKLPKTYPRAPPTITFTDPRGLSAGQTTALLRLATSKTRELLGTEMIYEVAVFCQEWITANHSVVRAGSGASLATEMNRRAQEIEREQRLLAAAAEAARLQAERAEADLLAQQIDADVRRKHEAIRLDRERHAPAEEGEDDASAGSGEAGTLRKSESAWVEDFGEEVELLEGGGRFGAVEVGAEVRRDALATVYYARPVIPGRTDAPLLDLEVYTISDAYYQTTQGKRKLQEVEKELARLRTVRHPNLLRLLSFKLARSRAFAPESWTLALLWERRGGSTLADLLAQCGDLRVELCKDYLVQILSGLDHLHSHNLCHKDITADQIVFAPKPSKSSLAPTPSPLTPTGSRPAPPAPQTPTLQLAGASYRRRLLDLHRSNPFSPSPSTDVDADAADAAPMPDGWQAPEALESPHAYTRKRDIWQVGVAFAQMLFGTHVLDFPDLRSVLESSSNNLPASVGDLLQNMFEPQPKQRATAVQILDKLWDVASRPKRPSMAMRKSSDGIAALPPLREMPPLLGTTPPGGGGFLNNNNMTSLGAFWQTHTANQNPAGVSRFRNDFKEVEFLGKGGFGEVVKAQNRFDKRFYAIKKVKLRAGDNDAKLFREVSALSRLNHQYVVRYFGCWLEEIAEHPKHHDDSSSSLAAESGPTDSLSFDMQDVLNPRFDDSLSVARAKKKPADDDDDGIMFAASEDEEESGSGSDSDSDLEVLSPTSLESLSQPPAVRISSRRGGARPGAVGGRIPSRPPPVKRTRILYIQMEYCEKLTLAEAIEEGLSAEERWRLLRQILEGLAYINTLGIIHRDLKPSNIFVDAKGDVKLGDFGLATTDNHILSSERDRIGSLDQLYLSDQTSGVGTSLYVAPEVERGARGGRYDEKVDLFSLGVIFMEMNMRLATGMERVQVIRALRLPSVQFPTNWPTDRVNERKLIEWMCTHDPTNRPTAAEVLRSNLLPELMEEEYFEEALRVLANPEQPHYQRLLKTLFRQPVNPLQFFTYDTGGGPVSADAILSIVRDHLVRLFEKHGAIPLQAPLLSPRSPFDAERPHAVQFLDSTGCIVQLPSDGMLPFARLAARRGLYRMKRFWVGARYRENVAGGQPLQEPEADFDIISIQKTLAAEAETLSVVSEVLLMPGLGSEWVICINHSRVVDLVLEHISPKQRPAVVELLEQLGKGLTMTQLRSQLTGRLGISRSVIEELEMFDIAGEPATVLRKLQEQFPHARSALEEALSETTEMLSLARRLKIRQSVVFRPLFVVNYGYFRSGLFFEVQHKGKRRDVIAVGGRYDSLLAKLSNPSRSNATSQRAVGVQLNVNLLVDALTEFRDVTLKKLLNKRNEAERSFGIWTPRRCDVYVVSFGRGLLQERLDIVSVLWEAGISADLMYDHAVGVGPEEIVDKCRAEGIAWIIIAKQTSGNRDALIKVRSTLRRADHEVPRSELVTWLQRELAEQTRVDNAHAGTSSVATTVREAPAHALGKPAQVRQQLSSRGSEVHLVLPHDRGKKHKRQRQLVMERAEEFMIGLSSHIAAAKIPVLAVDISGLAFARMGASTDWLTDDEKFRRCTDAMPSNEVHYGILVREKVLEYSVGQKWLLLFSLRENRACLLSFS